MQTENIGTHHRQVEAEKEWCALHTRHQHESLVDGLLRMKGFDTFYPTSNRIHVWKDRKKRISEALFPVICLSRTLARTAWRWCQPQAFARSYRSPACLQRSQMTKSNPFGGRYQVLIPSNLTRT